MALILKLSKTSVALAPVTSVALNCKPVDHGGRLSRGELLSHSKLKRSGKDWRGECC